MNAGSFNILVGKTIKSIVYDDSDMNDYVYIYFTDGSSYVFQTNGGDSQTGKGWSTIHICENSN